jgi:hypothetical protein
MATKKPNTDAGVTTANSETGHDIASVASRELCELFGERIRSIVSSAQRTPTQTWCAYSVVEATKPIAWISHTKKKGTITVWIRRDAAEPMILGGSNLPFKTRPPGYMGPFQWYGHYVQIANPLELDELFSIMRRNGFYGATPVESEREPADRIYPDELSGTEEYLEGIGKRVLVNRYERNSSARQACLKHYGCVCVVCGMSFGEIYGPAVLGIMHVHHLNPRSDADGDVIVNPVVDLRPVCPNCHTVIHSRQPCYSIEEVRSMLNTRNL